MKRIAVLLLFAVLVTSTLFAQETISVKVLPERWSMGTHHNKARVKAEIFGLDPSASISNVMMNGVPALRTQNSTGKLTAFFSKADVLATLPAVQKGQQATIGVTFTNGAAPASLTDTITISGKKSSTHGHQPHTQGNTNGNGNGNGHAPTTPPGNPH